MTTALGCTVLRAMNSSNAKGDHEPKDISNWDNERVVHTRSRPSCLSLMFIGKPGWETVLYATKRVGILELLHL